MFKKIKLDISEDDSILEYDNSIPMFTAKESGTYLVNGKEIRLEKGETIKI